MSKVRFITRDEWSEVTLPVAGELLRVSELRPLIEAFLRYSLEEEQKAAEPLTLHNGIE